MSIITFIPLFFGLRGAEWWIILIAGLIIFGAARLPKIMRNLGKGVHSFKQGVEEAKAEMNKPVKTAEEIVRERNAQAEAAQPVQPVVHTANVKDTDGPND